MSHARVLSHPGGAQDEGWRSAELHVGPWSCRVAGNCVCVCVCVCPVSKVAVAGL